MQLNETELGVPMRRRSFFRGLLGLPIAAPAAAASIAIAARKPEPVLAGGDIPTCECGYVFRIWSYDFHSRVSYMSCQNPKCRYHGRKFALPRVALVDADPRLVRRVDDWNASCR
jgi:hypothetical protein